MGDKLAELEATATGGTAGRAEYRDAQTRVQEDTKSALDLALGAAQSRGAPGGAVAALDSIIRPYGDSAVSRLGSVSAATAAPSGLGAFKGRMSDVESMAYNRALSDAQERQAAASRAKAAQDKFFDDIYNLTERRWAAEGQGDLLRDDAVAEASAAADYDNYMAKTRALGASGLSADPLLAAAMMQGLIETDDPAEQRALLAEGAKIPASLAKLRADEEAAAEAAYRAETAGQRAAGYYIPDDAYYDPGTGRYVKYGDPTFSPVFPTWDDGPEPYQAPDRSYPDIFGDVNLNRSGMMLDDNAEQFTDRSRMIGAMEEGLYDPLFQRQAYLDLGGDPLLAGGMFRVDPEQQQAIDQYLETGYISDEDADLAFEAEAQQVAAGAGVTMDAVKVAANLPGVQDEVDVLEALGDPDVSLLLSQILAAAQADLMAEVEPEVAAAQLRKNLAEAPFDEDVRALVTAVAFGTFEDLSKAIGLGS